MSRLAASSRSVGSLHRLLARVARLRHRRALGRALRSRRDPRGRGERARAQRPATRSRPSWTSDITAWKGDDAEARAAGAETIDAGG